MRVMMRRGTSYGLLVLAFGHRHGHLRESETDNSHIRRFQTSPKKQQENRYKLELRTTALEHRLARVLGTAHLPWEKQRQR
jgi:hypothetical protein